MLILVLNLLLSTAHALSFQGKDVVTQKAISFPSASAKATVVMFVSAKCPCSASHEASLSALAKEYSAKGYEFVGVHSNQDESTDQALNHFKAGTLPFPVIEDRGAKIANELKALKTPHVFIIQKNKIVYEGGVDDSADAGSAQKFFLKNALTEINEGKPVTLAKARALGCMIKR